VIAHTPSLERRLSCALPGVSVSFERVTHVIRLSIDRHARQHAAARALIQQAEDGDIVAVVPGQMSSTRFASPLPAPSAAMRLRPSTGSSRTSWKASASPRTSEERSK
jgi:hypothetical protein